MPYITLGVSKEIFCFFLFCFGSLVGDETLSLDDDNDDDELLGLVNVFSVFQSTVFTKLLFLIFAPSFAHGSSFMLAPLSFS